MDNSREKELREIAKKYGKEKELEETDAYLLKVMCEATDAPPSERGEAIMNALRLSCFLHDLFIAWCESCGELEAELIGIEEDDCLPDWITRR